MTTIIAGPNAVPSHLTSESLMKFDQELFNAVKLNQRDDYIKDALIKYRKKLITSYNIIK